MSFDLFAPQGGNPLGQLKVVTPRCARVDFDRSVRSNVLVMDGDVTQSKIQLPKEDRPLHSLQLPQPIVGLQLMCPSNGQLAIEFTLSHSNMARLRVTAGTFISRADVHDAKGTPHVKLPFAIPRNVWTQAIVHISGVVCHLFKLPPVKWVDSITISGTARIRRIFASPDEAHALEKPSGMLLFTVPAYGPPVWRGASTGVSQQPQSQQSPTAAAAPPQQEQGNGDADGAAGKGKTPFTMRFSRQANGEVTFSAASKEQLERQQQQERQQAALREKQQQRIGQNDSPANVMQHLPNDGVGGRETPPVGVEAWEVDDDETAAATAGPGGAAMPTRSPRTQAIVAALQGRPPHGTLQPGRTNSAPAGSLAVSYRRLVRESKQREAPLSTGYGIPRRDAEPKKSAAEIAAAEAEAAWGCVVLDGWADDDEEETDVTAAIAVAKTLGLDPSTPPQGPSATGTGEKRNTPPPLSPASQKVGAKATAAAGAGPSGRAPAVAGQSTPTARGPALSTNSAAAGRPAGGPSGRSSSRPAGRGGPAAAASPPPPSTQAAPSAEDDLLAACAKGALRTDSQQFTFVPKKDRVVGFGVGDLEVERTRSSSDDDSDDDESDDTDDSDSDSDAQPANRRRPGYAAPLRGGGGGGRR